MIKVDANSSPDFFEFLKYKELIYYLTWRDFKVRYKQAVLGVLWTILQPLVFSLIIGLIIVRRSNFDFGFDGISSMSIVLLSFSIWTYFESSFSASSASMLANQGLMKKVYFPKIILIISSILTRLIDFFLSFGLFIGFILITGTPVSLVGFAILLPVILALTITTFFTGLLLAPLNVKFRDIKFLLPFVTRIMFFSTPIWYPFSLIPDTWQTYFLLNPVVAAIEITRNGFFNPSAIALSDIVIPSITIILLGLISIPIYRNQEPKVVDYV